jgi:hypothetical protein
VGGGRKHRVPGPALRARVRDPTGESLRVWDEEPSAVVCRVRSHGRRACPGAHITITWASMAQSVQPDGTDVRYDRDIRTWERDQVDVLITRGEKVDLAWLVDALEHARSHGQTRLVDYLESIADDAVFEMEMAARSPRR